MAWFHQALGAVLVLYAGLHDCLWSQEVSDSPDPEAGLEQIWFFIRMRFGPEQHSAMLDHFEKHIQEDGTDVAYQCLIRNLLGVLESLNLSRTIHTFPAKWLLRFAVDTEGNEDNDP